MMGRHRVFVFVSCFSSVIKFDKKCTNSTQRSQSPNSFEVDHCFCKVDENVTSKYNLENVGLPITITTDSVDELMEKLLLLENVDFELSTNGRMVTEMGDHQDKPDDQTKDN